jgi:hypothetical protein
MFRRIFLVIPIGACAIFFSALCLSQQAPVSVLLDNVRDCADYAASYTGYLKPGNSLSPLKDEAAGYVFKRVTEGIDAVDKALAAGVPGTRTIEVKFEGGSRSMSLLEVKQMCQRVAAFTGKTHYRQHAAQEATNAAVWPKLLANNGVDRVQAKGAADAGKACVDAIDEALTNGIAGGTEVQVLDHEMSLSDAKEMCVYVRDASQKLVDQNQASENAQYEPFRKALGGDKLALYNDRLKIYEVYGAGGRVLNTPQDYASSPLWCTSGVDRNGVLPRWDVDCWHFRGMTQVGSVVNRSGAGEYPPSSAYR